MLVTQHDHEATLKEAVPVASPSALPLSEYPPPSFLLALLAQTRGALQRQRGSAHDAGVLDLINNIDKATKQCLSS